MSISKDKIKIMLLFPFSVLLCVLAQVFAAPCKCEQSTSFVLPLILAQGPFNLLWFIKTKGASEIVYVINLLAPMFLYLGYAWILCRQKSTYVSVVVWAVHLVPCIIAIGCIALDMMHPLGKTDHILLPISSGHRETSLILLTIFCLIFVRIIWILVSIRKASLKSEDDEQLYEGTH